MSRLEELIELAQKGDRQASEDLVNENTGLIWAIAKRYMGRGTEPEDLYQLGCLGFLKAVEGFNLQYGTQFSTYAVPKIAGEIRRFLRDDGVIKVSRSLKEQAIQIRTVRSQSGLSADLLDRGIPAQGQGQLTSHRPDLNGLLFQASGYFYDPVIP